jgi:RNA polymerase sigma factor (sigma-70 family)
MGQFSSCSGVVQAVKPLSTEQQLVLDHVGIAHEVARRYRGLQLTGGSHDDLVQDSLLGLVHAASTYDAAAAGFSTHAWWWCRAFTAVAVRRMASTANITSWAARTKAHQRASFGDVSLDAPLSSDSDLTRLDLLEAEVVEHDFLETAWLTRMCEQAAQRSAQGPKSKRTVDQCRRILGLALTDETPTALAAELGVSARRVNQLKDAMLADLRGMCHEAVS